MNTPALPPVLVASHERSGTHLLLNSLGDAFGYRGQDYIDYNHNKVFPELNFYYPAQVTEAFQWISQFVRRPVKSHHAFDFFRASIEPILEKYRVLYVYRRPQEVMPSFRRFLHFWPWNEGPRVATDSDFIRCRPFGHMMRYQMFQQPSMIHRWANHVDSWLAAAGQHERILAISYDALTEHYPSTIAQIGDYLGLTPISTQKPEFSAPQIKTLPTDHPAYDGGGLNNADIALIHETIGPLLERHQLQDWVGQDPHGMVD